MFVFSKTESEALFYGVFVIFLSFSFFKTIVGQNNTALSSHHFSTKETCHHNNKEAINLTNLVLEAREVV